VSTAREEAGCLGSLAQADHGAAAVETAVSASVLFMTLVGLMKICLAVYTYHYVSEAAREGTRYAIVRGSACNPTYMPSPCPAATDGSDVQTYVKSLGYPGITPAAMTVTTTYAGFPAGVVCTPSSACNNPGNMATVQVQYAFPMSIPFMPNKTWTMTSTAAMVISQ
jgi:Flp pilus assembly protein TadG